VVHGKPPVLHDRDAEWGVLVEFATNPAPGATLALVYGRRRQGKTLMLELLAEVTGGFLFTGLQQSQAQNLTDLGVAYARRVGARGRVAFADWPEAMTALLAMGEDSPAPVPVILDEFPYLSDGTDTLPSVIQNALSPRGAARRRSRARLVLCGSAISVVRDLLRGSAPLRGRATTELVVHPFGFRDTAGLWGLTRAPEVALRVHALLGGTPAYRDMCGGDAPESADDVDAWVVRRLLDPASAMFREGHLLLSEEPSISDLTPYHAVLAAISAGRTRRGEIAQAIGRADSALAHPLTVLEEARLVERVEDAFRQKRATYLVSEPVIRLHELVIRRHEARLARRGADRVWAEVQDTVRSKIYGPHFEAVAREWCLTHAAPSTLGGSAGRVQPATVPCPAHRSDHELDVVVTTIADNAPDRVTAIGEAKWHGEPVGVGQLERLEHIRPLLPPRRTPEPPRLLLFSLTGFTPDLSRAARRRDDVELIALDRLYRGS